VSVGKELTGFVHNAWLVVGRRVQGFVRLVMLVVGVVKEATGFVRNVCHLVCRVVQRLVWVVMSMVSEVGWRGSFRLYNTITIHVGWFAVAVRMCWLCFSS
jgi:hypothetical protein